MYINFVLTKLTCSVGPEAKVVQEAWVLELVVVVVVGGGVQQGVQAQLHVQAVSLLTLPL